jgi:putative Holliday junction resolvase
MGDAAVTTLQFMERLRAEIDVPIVTQDERLTSYEAEQLMMERGLNRAQRRQHSDEMAATIILQDYLSKLMTND